MSTPALSLPTATGLPAPTPALAVARWSLAQFVLFSAVVAVLGSAIGWPGILRASAPTVLATIHEHALAASVGYGLYLVCAVALIGLSLSLGRLLRAQAHDAAGVELLTALGVASGVLKTLGIVRWLSVMPGLAASYASPDTPAASMAAIELLYTSFNAYAGSVGELLGVQLFGGLWMLGVSALLLRARWRVAGVLGIASGAVFTVLTLRVFFDELGALNAVVGPMGLAWLLVLAVSAWRRRAARPA